MHSIPLRLKSLGLQKDLVKPSATKGTYRSVSDFCASLLSNDADQGLVARGAAEGEGDLVVAFEGDRVGEFDSDLREGEVGEFANVFDCERVDVMLAVFQLDVNGCSGFAGLELDSSGEEHDARALVGAEVKEVYE